MGPCFFGTGAFVALGVGFVLTPSGLFRDFLFPSYARFCEGTRPTRQKVFPHPTVRTPSASNSPSALSANITKRPEMTKKIAHGANVQLLLIILANPHPAIFQFNLKWWKSGCQITEFSFHFYFSFLRLAPTPPPRWVGITFKLY